MIIGYYYGRHHSHHTGHHHGQHHDNRCGQHHDSHHEHLSWQSIEMDWWWSPVKEGNQNFMIHDRVAKNDALKTPWFWRVIRSRNQTLLAFYKILPLCIEVQESCCNLRYDRMLKYSVRSRLMGRPSENKETHCYRGMPSVQLVAIQPVQPSHTSQIVDSAQHFNFWNPFLCKNKNENKNTPLNLRIYFVVILIVNSGPTGSYSNCAFLVYTARITFPNSGMSHPIFQKITLRQYFKVGDYRHQSAGTLGNCCH